MAAPFAPRAWSDLSLARQFALAGGVVMLVSALLVGAFVSRRVEEVVVRNAANATALYMESFLAPLTQGLASDTSLTAASRGEIERLLDETALGQRVVSFKIWRKGGLLVDASNTGLVGQTFDVTENLKLAWQGEVRADFDDTGDQEDVAEDAMGLPLLEIYSPIREVGSGRVIAVAEFYEIATQLKADLARVRAVAWASVAGVMTLIGGSLFAIVLRGSRTIDAQVMALKDMSGRNLALRLRVQGAAARFAAMNDQALRRIGADIHDGPAQLMGFAALRLDALRGQVAGPAVQADIEAVESAVKDSIVELRNIARGLSMPDVERKSIEDILRGLVDAHAGRTGNDVGFSFDMGGRGDLPPAVKICAFRFVQEGLSNAWRHADGRGQEVRLAMRGDLLTLSVLDRGNGFAELPPGPSLEGEGLGLPGLMDRVESLGGHVDLRDRVGGGAEITMTLDVKGSA
jgi:signal transduction histidine kinase